MGAVAELPAGRWNHTHLPLRMAYRDRLHRRHSAVAARSWTGFVQVRRLGQHNDPGGLRDRVGDRRRRRDPRRREHHAAPASGAAGGDKRSTARIILWTSLDMWAPNVYATLIVVTA